MSFKDKELVQRCFLVFDIFLFQQQRQKHFVDCDITCLRELMRGLKLAESNNRNIKGI